MSALSTPMCIFSRWFFVTWFVLAYILPKSCYCQREAIHLASKTLPHPTSSNTNGKNKKHILFQKDNGGTFAVAAAASSVTEDDQPTDVVEEDEIEMDSGFLQSVEVAFEGIKMILQGKKQSQDRVILDGSIKGKARPGRMLAVMGPSGSGKSTLIHALAGLVKENKRITVSGNRYINGHQLAGDSPLPAAFIEQEVKFFPHMTVKETLDFRVELKLGSTLGKAARDDVVENLINLLGLTQSANTIVGNSKVRGLSGGERKRLSIACEMISSPPIIILDEPTSGLDSYQANQVVKVLRKLADSGKTVIAVIHQPSQNVLSMFDDLLLISEGRQMYYGELSKARTYFNTLGYSSPPDVGLSEYILECVSRTNGGPEEQKKSSERISRIASEANKNSHSINLSIKDKAVSKDDLRKLKMIQKTSNRPAAGILRQFKLLLGRALSETVRDKASLIIKIVQQVTLGFIYGSIYKLSRNQASVRDRIGLLSLIAIGTMNMATVTTIKTFPKEKSIVSAEMASNMYRTLPYFIAKALSEIPLVGVFNAIFAAIIYPLSGLQKGRFMNFLGLSTLHTLTSEAAGLLISSISPSSDVALSLFPPLVVLNIIFDGRNISEENTPRLLRWIPKVGLVRWAFEGLAVNEFSGLTFDISGPRRGPVIKDGSEALATFGIGKRTVWEVVAAQRNIVSICWLLSYLGISLTRQKFEVMRSPE